ncbi:MAG: pentapeptide repeat-containing protein, partial [Pseudomonadota bacterium]
HRFTLLADVFVLAAIGVFLRRTDTSFLPALFGVARRSPTNFIITGLLVTLALFFSFFIATVPGERLDRISREIPALAQARSEDQPTAGFAEFLLSSSPLTQAIGIERLFHRNLEVMDQDLVSDRLDETTNSEASLILRGRDLRYARLDRTDLHRADLTGADLTGASLIGADLRDVKASCSDLTAVLTLGQSRAASCTRLDGVKLARADVTGASFQAAFLSNASFEEATLDRANFSYADLTGVDFSAARMRRVALTGGADILGANFLGASLQGADFTGAKLQLADFSGAALQGGLFGFAQLQGATFQGAEMDGANLTSVRLHGADLSGAVLTAADLSASKVWLTEPPEPTGTRLLDASRLKIAVPDRGDMSVLDVAIEVTSDGRLRERLQALRDRLADGEASQAWETSGAAERWRDYQVLNGGEEGPTALSAALVGLGCQIRWSDGAVAAGIVQRSLTRAFKGEIRTVLNGLNDRECPASQTIGAPLLQELATLVERQTLERRAAQQRPATGN